MNKIEYWTEEMSYLDDDLERYQFLIDLAKRPVTLPAELRIDENLVSGCISQIWVAVGREGDQVKTYYDSDALITKGITHIICDCFDGMTVDQAANMSRHDFADLGIAEILSANRRSGLSSIIDTIIRKAREL